MPTYEEVMRDRNKLRGLSGITKKMHPSQMPGIDIKQMIECPHCKGVFPMWMKVDALRANIFIPFIDKKGSAIFTNKPAKG